MISVVENEIGAVPGGSGSGRLFGAPESRG
jgi:hypothetical protein